MAWPSTVVVGRSPSILAHVLRPMIMLSGLPLVAPHVPSVGVGVVLVIAVVITMVVVVTTVIVIPAIAVASAIVIPSAIVIIPPIVLVALVLLVVIIVVFLVATVVSVPITGLWPVAFPVCWLTPCLGLGWLWFDMPNWRDIPIE